MSPSSVEEAAVPDDGSAYTAPNALTLSVPTVVVDSVMNAVFRFVVEAVRNEE